MGHVLSWFPTLFDAGSVCQTNGKTSKPGKPIWTPTPSHLSWEMLVTAGAYDWVPQHVDFHVGRGNPVEALLWLIDDSAARFFGTPNSPRQAGQFVHSLSIFYSWKMLEKQQVWRMQSSVGRSNLQMKMELAEAEGDEGDLTTKRLWKSVEVCVKLYEVHRIVASSWMIS